MKYFETQKHLGTDIEIQVLSDNSQTSPFIEELFLYCADFEKEFSRFLPESQLSILNKEKKLEASHRFLELLQLSLSLKNETQGLFSPFVQVANLGYTGTFENGVFTPEIDTPVEEEILIEGNTVTLGKNTFIDFGGIGKGYLVELLRNKLLENGFSNFCINAGGDLVVEGKNEKNTDWVIGVENPFTGENMGTFFGSHISVNTSGNYKRKWENSGKKYHHIVHPVSGKNVNEFSSVTLIHTNCAFGDALTKGVWHTSFDDLGAYFKKHSLEGLVIRNDGKVFSTPNMFLKYQFER